MKKLLQHSWNGRALDDEQFCRSLLQYHNTPSRKDGLSPAQKLFGHPVQDILPAHRRSFLPQWQLPPQEAIQQAEDTSKLSAAYYNLHAHTLPDIHVGSHVAVQNPQSRLWDIYGIVTEIGPHHRYYIKTTGGRVLIRNRRFLRRRVPASLSKEPECPTPTDPISTGAPHIPRRSTRDKRPTRRLIEDSDWIEILAIVSIHCCIRLGSLLYNFVGNVTDQS